MRDTLLRIGRHSDHHASGAEPKRQLESYDWLFSSIKPAMSEIQIADVAERGPAVTMLNPGWVNTVRVLVFMGWAWLMVLDYHFIYTRKRKHSGVIALSDVRPAIFPIKSGLPEKGRAGF